MAPKNLPFVYLLFLNIRSTLLKKVTPLITKFSLYSNTSYKIIARFLNFSLA